MGTLLSKLVPPSSWEGESIFRVPKGSQSQFILTVSQWASVLTSLCLCSLNCKARWAVPILWGECGVTSQSGRYHRSWLRSPEDGETLSQVSQWMGLWCPAPSYSLWGCLIFASDLVNNSFLLFGKLSPAILDLSICSEIVSLSLIYCNYR